MQNILKLYCVQSFSIQNLRSSPRIKFTHLWFVEAAFIRLRMLQMFGYLWDTPINPHIKLSSKNIHEQCGCFGISRPYLRSLGGDLTVTSDITYGFLRRLNQLNMSIVFFVFILPKVWEKILWTWSFWGPCRKSRQGKPSCIMRFFSSNYNSKSKHPKK